MEDIFNESDESASSEDEEKTNKMQDDLDDEENPPEDKLLSLESDSSQGKSQDPNASSDSDEGKVNSISTRCACN